MRSQVKYRAAQVGELTDRLPLRMMSKSWYRWPYSESPFSWVMVGDSNRSNWNRSGLLMNSDTACAAVAFTVATSCNTKSTPQNKTLPNFHSLHDDLPIFLQTFVSHFVFWAFCIMQGRMHQTTVDAWLKGRWSAMSGEGTQRSWVYDICIACSMSLQASWYAKSNKSARLSNMSQATLQSVYQALHLTLQKWHTHPWLYTKTMCTTMTTQGLPLDLMTVCKLSKNQRQCSSDSMYWQGTTQKLL